jgi:hypothetical protein
MQVISLAKTYTTRSGRPVKLLMTDGGGKYPVIGATLMADTGVWEPDRWRADGSYHTAPSSMDLVEAQQRNVA